MQQKARLQVYLLNPLVLEEITIRLLGDFGDVIPEAIVWCLATRIYAIPFSPFPITMFTQTPSRTSRKRNADQFAGLQPPAKPIFTPAPQQPPPQLIPQPSPGPENAPTTVVADPFSSRQQGTTRLVEPVSFISALYPELQQQRVQRPRVHESVLTRYAEPEVPALEGSVLDDDRTTMDLEPPSWRNANTLVEGDKHVVEVLGKIPSEVQEAFRDSDGRVDFYQHAYGARVDPTIGYALVWTKSHAFVWFYQRHAVPTLPTCFIFPLPQITVPGKPIPPLPLVVIVPPLDRNREPGLIACSVDGEIRYWEAVSLALSSPDRFSSVRLYLNEGENITVFNVVEEGIYILGTSHTRLLRVTLDPRLQSSALAKPVGVLARVGNLLGYRDPDATNEELEVARRVVAIVPGVRVEMREFVSEQDILTPIRENILSNVQPEAKMPQKAFKVTLGQSIGGVDVVCGQPSSGPRPGRSRGAVVLNRCARDEVRRADGKRVCRCREDRFEAFVGVYLVGEGSGGG
ncbi:hypothetical protein BC936DRAFT_145036, partial [Jimgerdemannia flammicorona]